jgi:hypothetical protein
MKQLWYCEQCEQGSRVIVNEGDDVLIVLYRIADSHARVSPDCHNDTRKIRVINMDLIPDLK